VPVTSPLPPCPVLSLRLIVVVENTSLRPDLIGQHGFAALLETERGAILFDTGATDEALAARVRSLPAAAPAKTRAEMNPTRAAKARTVLRPFAFVASPLSQRLFT